MTTRALAKDNPASQGLRALFKEHENAKKQASMQPLIKTNHELDEILKNDGQNWRNEHVEVYKNGKERVIHPSPRQVADILENRLNYGIIAETEEEAEKGRVAFYDYDTGLYNVSERQLKRLALMVERTLTIRQQKEVLNYLFLDSKLLKEIKDKNLVPVGNGVFNRTTKELMPYSPSKVFTHKLLTNYKPNAVEPVFDGWSVSKWFKQIADGDHDKETLLWQIITAVVNPNLTTDVAVFLVDDQQGRTGKSTFERMLENLVGPGNYGSLKLKEFEQDFKLATATGKALIIGDDNNPNDYNKTSENFKSVATGENVLINPKGTIPFNYRFNNFIVQSMNGLPRFSDTSDALFRRFRVVVFNHQYQATSANKRIKDEYIKDHRLLEFILKKSLEYDIDSLINTKESQAIIRDMKLDNDTVDYFIQNYLNELQSDRVPVAFLFKFFLAAMDYENNPQKMKQNTFTRQAKPLMKQQGWDYARNNLAPLDGWDEIDMKLLEKYDLHYQFKVEIEPHKKQPLFEKATNVSKWQQANKQCCF